MTNKTGVARILRAFFSHATAIKIGRVAAGVAAVIVGVLLSNSSLSVAVLVLGIFIIVHAMLDSAFQAVRNDFSPEADSGMRDFAASFVATSGVILGLLSAFGDKPFSQTVRVGIIALVADILVGTVLVGLLLAGADEDDQPAWNMLRCVFLIALWALALGLLCIAMGLLYR